MSAVQDENNACYIAPFELNLPDTCNIDCVECRDGLGNKVEYIVNNLALYFDINIGVGDITIDPTSGQVFLDDVSFGNEQEDAQLNPLQMVMLQNGNLLWKPVTQSVTNSLFPPVRYMMHNFYKM